MKLNDYMSVGKPTVATAVGDVPDVIKQHQIGVMTHPTAEDIAQKTVDLLSDPGQLAQLGENARRAAEETYDWAIMSQRMLNFYQSRLEAIADR